MNLILKFLRFCFFSIYVLSFFSTTPALAETSFFKNKSVDFFPVPVITSRPDEKESYGLMPVMILSDKDTKAIQTIIALMGQYNTITKINGTALMQYYPHPTQNADENFQFYFQMAERYYREITLDYFNPHFGEKLYIDTNFSWLKTPFRHFYGYGADSPESGETNYVSRNFYTSFLMGYYLHPHFRVNFTESFVSTDLLNRAIEDVGDTLTVYGALSGVNDETNLIHRLSTTYDTRPAGPMSFEGFFAEAGYFFSHEALGSDSAFHGFSLEAIHLHSMFDDRTTTVLRAFVQDMFGDEIPFYLRSSLGGDRELRSFIPNRFVDNGKFLLTWEQRIRVFKKVIFEIPIELSLDPFVEIGRVFRHIYDAGSGDVQTVGGLGVRFLVRPNVVGRLDFAVGSEGYNVYTQLGYPF